MFDKLFKGNILKKIEKISKNTSLFFIPSISYGMNDHIQIAFLTNSFRNRFNENYGNTQIKNNIYLIGPINRNSQNPQIILKTSTNLNALVNEYDNSDKLISLAAKNQIIRYSAIRNNNIIIGLYTEYCELGNLRDFRRRLQNLNPIYVTCMVAKRLVDILLNFYSNKFVHFNISPLTILIDSYFNIKLCGLDNGEFIENNHEIQLRKTNYLFNAPEVLKGENISGIKNLSKAEIFSLGCILYWLFTGRYPYENPDTIHTPETLYINNVCDKNFEVDYSPFKEYLYFEKGKEEFIKQLVDFIKKCLEPDYEKRIGISELIEHPFIKVFCKYIQEFKDNLNNANILYTGFVTGNIPEIDKTIENTHIKKDKIEEILNKNIKNKRKKRFFRKIKSKNKNK